ncbi:MAG TPA: hypothetical protein PLM80_03205 [Mesotoga sp.]|jgi:hypothetical protein|nr:hypothetical protein [Mesotoga sp.]MDI9375303.1 hypothetical protein [Thermotogota bacterium]NLX33758.1 hypothetical protein [Thermotogaceae bacterium]MDD4041231.1 hypothetical protein [Mesotoga sp.]MDD4478834.1 hypothetical protein [Mesotoga sp.]
MAGREYSFKQKIIETPHDVTVRDMSVGIDGIAYISISVPSLEVSGQSSIDGYFKAGYYPSSKGRPAHLGISLKVDDKRHEGMTLSLEATAVLQKWYEKAYADIKRRFKSIVDRVVDDELPVIFSLAGDDFPKFTPSLQIEDEDLKHESYKVLKHAIVRFFKLHGAERYAKVARADDYLVESIPPPPVSDDRLPPTAFDIEHERDLYDIYGTGPGSVFSFKMKLSDILNPGLKQLLEREEN